MKEPNLIIENLKAILEECTASEDAVSYVNSEDAGTLKAAIEALKKQEQDRWIPCNERLPEEDDYRPCYGYDDGAVWWCNDIGVIGLGWYYASTEKWAFYDETTHTEGVVGNVTAWRPLPEAYKAEDTE